MKTLEELKCLDYISNELKNYYEHLYIIHRDTRGELIVKKKKANEYLEPIKKALLKAQELEKENQELLQVVALFKQKLEDTDNIKVAQTMMKQLDKIVSLEKENKALLKAQEPKQYLKWEDLEFDNNTQVKKYLKVKLGDNIYKAYYHFCFLLNSELFCIENDNENLNIYITNKQFFNDLRLEVLE